MFVSLERWEYTADELGAFTWNIPGAVGLDDLRTWSQMGARGGVPGGYAMAVLPNLSTRPGTMFLTDDPTGSMPLAKRQDMAREIDGLDTHDLDDVSSCAQAFWKIKTQMADPTRLNAVGPLSPRLDLQIGYSIPGFVTQYERFTGFADYPRVLEDIQLAYKNYREYYLTSFPPESKWHRHYLRILDGYRAKYRTSDYRQFQFNLPEEVPLPRGSIFGDTFVEGTDTAIASHTPTGPNAGTSWVVNGGGFTIIAADDRASNANTNDEDIAHLSDSLSGDDQYAQGDVDNIVNKFGGTACRVAASAETYYLSLYNPSTTYIIGKMITNSTTTLVNVTGTDNGGTGLLRFEVNGNDKTLKLAGVTEATESVDTAITTGVLAGIYGRFGGGANRARIDNFEMADLAAAQSALLAMTNAYASQR